MEQTQRQTKLERMLDPANSDMLDRKINEELKDIDDIEITPDEAEGISAANTFDLVKSLYKNDYGHPFEMTPGQNEIFDAIFFKKSPDGKNRIHIMTFTQYGKSDTVSMAVLTRASTFPEKWCIVAPSQSKARIIMGYVIKHLFENEYTLNRFKITEGENVDAIRRERSKNRLTFDIGNNQVGEIFILSAEARLKGEDAGNAMMGFGAPNVVEDEAALISDESDAKAMRMVGGFTSFGTDFVVKIGNPFQRNHFLKAYEDSNYYKINIDYPRGIKEGRLTEKFIEEMKGKPYFNVLYDNNFPSADDIDSKGWTQLLSEDDIDRAKIGFDEDIHHIGELRLGNDVARGGNCMTTWCKRSMNYAEIIKRVNEDNLMIIGGHTLYLMREENIKAGNTFIDDNGVGGGAVDSLRMQNIKIVAVNSAHKATDEKKFFNVRAESYWRVREWIKRGGRLSQDDCWYELTKIKYKPDSKGRVKIMSKDEMRAMGIESPDNADALMLTFVRATHGDIEEARRKRKEKRKKHTFNRGVKVSMGGY